MKHGFIKIATACPPVKVGNVRLNTENIKRIMTDAFGKNVNILVFPELCVSGYTCGDMFFNSALIDAVAVASADIAAFSVGLPDLLTFVGLPQIINGKLYNAAVAVQNGKIIATFLKQYLPNYAEFYEQRYFNTSDADNPILQFGLNDGFVRIGCEICEDLWAVSPPSERYALSGAEIIVNLSAGNETIAKADYRRNLVRMQSAKCVCAYVYASAGRGESTTDCVYSGHGIIAENGTIIAENAPFVFNELTITEVDLGKLQSERVRNTSFRTIPCEPVFVGQLSRNTRITELTRYYSKTPFVPDNPDTLRQNCELILTMQSEGLLTRAIHTNAKSLVLGLSGGLDSTLAYLVCLRVKDKLPNIDISAITMPCFGTTKRTKNNALSLCPNCRTIDITAAVKQHFADIGHNENTLNTVYENAQARERTQVLMDVANAENGLVVGTGDMSEYALGWATYAGDHISMYGVNGGVPKTLVKHLIKYYADFIADNVLKVVLYDILDTPVSPELLPPDKSGNISQKTEDIIGSYELNDFFLYYFARYGFPPDKIIRLAIYAFGLPSDTVKPAFNTFVKRFVTNQFKRSCMPDTPKIGSVSLSPRADLRMPSDFSSDLFKI
jgi:NAD+ synthase (glutamine-hydrolysing)